MVTNIRYYTALYVRQGLRLLWRNRFWSVLTGVVIGLLLFLVYLMVSAEAHTREAASRVDDQLVVTAVIHQDPETFKSTTPAAAVATQVRRIPGVTKVRIVSETEARDRFVRNVQDLRTKPPAHVFSEALEINVTDADKLGQVTDQVRTIAAIDQATYLSTLVKKLTSFSSWMRETALAFAILLGMVTVLIVTAVVRTAIQAEQRSVQTMAQVGGSSFGIAAPLLVHLLSVTAIASLISCVAGWWADPKIATGVIGNAQDLPEWMQTGRSFGLLVLWPPFALAAMFVVGVIVLWSTWRHTRATVQQA